MGNLCCSTIGATQMKKLDSTSESPEPPSGKSATKPTKGNTSYKQMESGNKSLDIVSSTISISPRTLAKTNAAKDGRNAPAVATPASVGLHVQGSNVDAPDKTIESSEGDALETQSPRRSISQLARWQVCCARGAGQRCQATVYKCAVGSEQVHGKKIQRRRRHRIMVHRQSQMLGTVPLQNLLHRQRVNFLP